ncbi:MAG: GNAT family N-acetyltransferase [Bacteroidales bacterium]|nr:GNAT family N-acetyltransferase [Bacteroidales bacterium]
MEEIISPVNKKLLKSELTSDRFLRSTRKGGNEIYIFKASDCPNLMDEIGRLREIAFRFAGGGTGMSKDIDSFDIMDEPYYQLIVWNPEDDEILGGYRYILGKNVKINEKREPLLATAHMFHFSEKFLQEVLPYTIELGRSFVTLEYQSSRAGSRGLFALDNLWDGLGALTVDNPEIKYFYGKFTMYPTYSPSARNLILYFLKKHFPDRENLIKPFNPLQTNINDAEMEKIFIYDSFKDDYKVLNTEVRKLGYNIPPLVNAYMSLSPTMRMFGTAINDEFGDVEESGILIAVEEINSEKRARYIETYEKYLEGKINID